MNRIVILLLGAVGLFLAGLSTGWWLQRPRPVVEPPAPASRQADGSLVLERTGTQIAPPKAPHALPKGAREERRVSVVVQPAKGIVSKTETVDSAEAARLVASNERDHVSQPGKMVDSCDCPPVTVDLSLVRMPDKSRRVIASSPDGTILSGIDVPISVTGDSPVRRPWAAGILFSADRKVGGFLDRDLGPFRVGVEAFQSTNGWTAQGRAGIRF